MGPHYKRGPGCKLSAHAQACTQSHTSVESANLCGWTRERLGEVAELNPTTRSLSVLALTSSCFSGICSNSHSNCKSSPIKCYLPISSSFTVRVENHTLPRNLSRKHGAAVRPRGDALFRRHFPRVLWLAILKVSLTPSGRTHRHPASCRAFTADRC